MTEFEAKVLADLCVLKNQMDQILGNGQPGRLHDLEQRQVATEIDIYRMRGAVAALGIVLTLVQLGVGYLTGRHP